MAIHQSLFAASGTNKDLDIIWKGLVRPEAIFFWSRNKLKSLPLPSLDGVPFEPIPMPDLHPKSELSPESLAELANSLIIHEYGPPCCRKTRRTAHRSSAYPHEVVWHLAGRKKPSTTSVICSFLGTSDPRSGTHDPGA